MNKKQIILRLSELICGACKFDDTNKNGECEIAEQIYTKIIIPLIRKNEEETIGFVISLIIPDYLSQTIIKKQEQIIDLKDEIARLKNKEEQSE